MESSVTPSTTSTTSTPMSLKDVSALADTNDTASVRAQYLDKTWSVVITLPGVVGEGAASSLEEALSTALSDAKGEDTQG